LQNHRPLAVCRDWLATGSGSRIVAALGLILLSLACGESSSSTGTTPDTQELPNTQELPDIDERTETRQVPDIDERTETQQVPDIDERTETQQVPDTQAVNEIESALPWRSELYPENWTPGFKKTDELFLQDYSYAGYKNGESKPQPSSLVFEVNDYGADPLGNLDSSQAVIDAINAASQTGGVIHFGDGLYRLDQRVQILAANVQLRGNGPSNSRLFFTLSEGMDFLAHITFKGPGTLTEQTLLAKDGAIFDTELWVNDATQFAPGEDIQVGWVITNAFVEEHGMSDTWKVFNGQWQAFFHRTVVAVDTSLTPHKITIDVPLRYPTLTANQAGVKKHPGMISECGISDLSLSNATDWDSAWKHKQVSILEFKNAKDCWVRNVTSFASPQSPVSGLGAGKHLQSSGLRITKSKRITVSDSSLAKAQNRGGGGNGYLFEVRQSSEILFKDCVAAAGRHNFIQNWGFGATGIVWLRVHSSKGEAVPLPLVDIGTLGYSEFHHSLATANLIDQSVLNDGWSAVNRGSYSSGAGHSATQNLFWNNTGTGSIKSRQYKMGYLVGTGPELTLYTKLPGPSTGGGKGTSPADWVEGAGNAANLEPQSLYEDQLERRLKN